MLLHANEANAFVLCVRVYVVVVARKHSVTKMFAFFQFMSSSSYSGVYFVPIVSLPFDLSHALYAYYGTMFHIVSEIYERQIEPLSFSHLWTGLHGFGLFTCLWIARFRCSIQLLIFS